MPLSLDGGYVNLLGENTPLIYDPLLYITWTRARRTTNIMPPSYIDDDGVVTSNGSVVTPEEIEIFKRDWNQISSCCGDYLDILGDKTFDNPDTGNPEHAQIYLYIRYSHTHTIQCKYND